MKKSALYAVTLAAVLSWSIPMAARADETEAMEVSAVIEVHGAKLDTEEAEPEETVQISEEEQQAVHNQNARQNLVHYALQFVGGRYKAGGNDPNTGADCSGFVKYVMQNGAGVTMNRSSSTQAAQGVPISANQMQPGDLIFYGNGSRINHVALYIGDGQIVHASTYKTGIKTSVWNYRAPVKIVSVLE